MKKDIRISLIILVTLGSLFFGLGITNATYSKIPCVVTPNFQSQTANDGRSPSELIIVYIRWSLGFLKHPEHSERPYYKELQDAVIDARNHYCARTGVEITTVPEIITALAEYIPLISSFSADPASVAPGQSSTLAWTSTNADKCSIDGIGDVSTSGTKVVSPTNTTSYNITCYKGTIASSVKSIIVTVTGVTSSGTNSTTNPYASTLSSASKNTVNTWITKNIKSRSTTLSSENYTKFIETIVTRLNQIKATTPASNGNKLNVINYLVWELQQILNESIFEGINLGWII